MHWISAEQIMPTTLATCSSFVVAGLLALTTALIPASAEVPVTSEGIAYRLEDGVASYREHHMLFKSRGNPARLVLYRCMDGAPFARKIMVDRTGAAMPDFDFIDGRTGHREGVRTTALGREVYWQKSSATTEKRRSLAIPRNAVIDAGFDAMIRSQWQRLASDAGINAQFLLPSALRFLKVGIEQVDDAPGTGVTRLRMRLDTWYGFAAPDAELDYRTSDRRLLRFRGIGTIRDLHGRNQAVRIEFPNGLQGKQVDNRELEAARLAPLTDRCRS